MARCRGSSSRPLLRVRNRRLLFIAPSAYPLGGVADWLDYCLPGLVEQGWDTTLGLVAGRFHDVDRYLERHPWHDTIAIPSVSGSQEGRVLSLMKAINHVSPDVVAMVNIADCYEAIRRLRLAGATSAKLAVTLHGLQLDMLDHLRADVDVIDGVVVSNRLAAAVARTYLASPHRVVYAPYGVPASTDAPIAHRDNAVLRLLYCGRIEQSQKRVLDIPQIVRNLVDSGVQVRTAIAGSGPDEGEFERRIVELGVSDHIALLGVLSPMQLAREYHLHDALLICSAWETGPIVAWEAMSHGLPVLSSRYVGSGLEAALANDVNCLLFPVGDCVVAAQLAQQLKDSNLRRRLGQAGLKLVQERYNRRTSVLQWSDALEQICQFAPRVASASNHRVASSRSRLDTWVGSTFAERVRRAVGIEFRHNEPGGEWPHTYLINDDQQMFLDRIAAIDVAPES